MGHLQKAISSCILQKTTGNENPAFTMPYKPYLVLYLTGRPYLRHNQPYCFYRVFRWYLVLYLISSCCPPPALIVRIPIPPLPHIGVSPMKIPGIALYPPLLTLCLPPLLTLLLLTTLLSCPYPTVRFKKPPAVDTPLLSYIFTRLHPDILCQTENRTILLWELRN